MGDIQGGLDTITCEDYESATRNSYILPLIQYWLYRKRYLEFVFSIRGHPSSFGNMRAFNAVNSPTLLKTKRVLCYGPKKLNL